jgi:hypothetical protein
MKAYTIFNNGFLTSPWRKVKAMLVSWEILKKLKVSLPILETILTDDIVMAKGLN